MSPSQGNCEATLHKPNHIFAPNQAFLFYPGTFQGITGLVTIGFHTFFIVGGDQPHDCLEIYPEIPSNTPEIEIMGHFRNFSKTGFEV